MAEHLNEYGGHIEALLRGWLTGAPVAGSRSGVELSSATAAAGLLVEGPSAWADGLAEGMRKLAVIGRGVGPLSSSPAALHLLRDEAGHARPVYHPLVVHLHLSAFASAYETMPVGLWSACEDAMPDVIAPMRQAEIYASLPPPMELVDVVLWQALCVVDQAALASRDVDIEVMDSVVHRIATLNARGTEPSPLHPRSVDESESLDAWTYRELCGLHALANLALARRHRGWAARVEQIALYHLENTQPDNTTTQPWALNAFLWSPRTRSFADQQLHDASTNGAARLGSVAAWLLADTARFLHELTA